MTTNSINNTSSNLTVSNVNITGSTISTLSSNSDLTLSPNGSGKVSIGGDYTLPNAAGTIGQSLMTDSSNNLVYTSGNKYLIQSQTVSNVATLDFVTGFSSSFTSYVFEFYAVFPEINSQILYFRVSSDGGATYINTSFYSHAIMGYNTAGNSININNVFSQGYIITSGNTNIYGGLYGTAQFYGFSNFNYKRALVSTIWADTGNNACVCNGTVDFTIAATIYNGVRFYFNSGNISSGTINMYGIT